MKRLTDKEINRKAFRYAGILTTATAVVIGLNILAGVNGYDVRNWEWWAISPALTLLIMRMAARLALK